LTAMGALVKPMGRRFITCDRCNTEYDIDPAEEPCCPLCFEKHLLEYALPRVRARINKLYKDESFKETEMLHDLVEMELIVDILLRKLDTE